MFNLISPEQVLAVTALIVSLIALIFTVRMYNLKAGQRFRCQYSTTSIIACTDQYVSRLIIENLKDKSAVIFSIHLRLGLNNYLLIEDFNDEPLILKPFEVYNKKYDPIIFYSAGSNKIDVGNLIYARKKHRIILITTNGKYSVKLFIPPDKILKEYFTNYYTSRIYPERLSYNDKYYGNNVKFLIDIKYTENESEVIGIHEGDFNRRIFKNFKLTKESLCTANDLNQFLELQKNQGNLQYQSVKVIDFNKQIAIESEDYVNRVSVTNVGFWQYHIVGRYLAFAEKIWYKKMQNKDNKKKAGKSSL